MVMESRAELAEVGDAKVQAVEAQMKQADSVQAIQRVQSVWIEGLVR